MATFSLLVTSTNIDSQSAFSACQFAQAIVKSDHQLSGIFFYQGGVHNSNQFQQPLSDEPNLLLSWQELARTCQVPLYVCVTAANKRGIIEPENNQSSNKASCNLAPEFTVAGLGELIVLAQQSDRLVQF